MSPALALLVFASTAGIYFAAALGTRAVIDASYRAVPWEFATWACAVVAWVVAVKVSLWYLVPEGTGLVTGAAIGVFVLRRKRARLRS